MTDDHAKQQAREAIIELEVALEKVARHFPQDGLAQVLPVLLGGTAGQLEQVLARRRAQGLQTSATGLELEREVMARGDKVELLAVMDAHQVPWTLNDLMIMPFGASKLRRALILRELPWVQEGGPLFPDPPAAITVAWARGDSISARRVAKSAQRHAVTDAVWWQQVLEGAACGLSMVLYDVQETWKRPKMMAMLKRQWTLAMAHGANPDLASMACAQLAYLPNQKQDATTPADVLRECGKHLMQTNHNPTLHEMSMFENVRDMVWSLRGEENVRVWTNFMKQNDTACDLTATDTTGGWQVSCEDSLERDPVLMTLSNPLFKTSTMRATTAYLDRQPGMRVSDERLADWLERIVEQTTESPMRGNKYALDSMKALAKWLDEPEYWPNFLTQTQRQRLDVFVQEVRGPLDDYCALMLRKLSAPSSHGAAKAGAGNVSEREIRLAVTFAARRSIATATPKPRF